LLDSWEVSTFRLFAKNLSEVREPGNTLAFLEEDGWPARGRVEAWARVMASSRMMTTTRRNPTVTTVLSSRVKVVHSWEGWEDVEAIWSGIEFGMTRRE